ncbi:MAG: NAD(P)/FAD-dependent oxidoreductase, partial [Candidatus Nanopelagicales bacterium]
MEHFDIAVIGAGPAGLYGTYYAGFRGFSTVLIDALEEPGGQVTAMYPEKDIFDIAGFPKVRGRDLVDGLLEKALQFNQTLIMNTNVETLMSRKDDVELSLSNGRTLTVKAVVITGGIGAFTPRPLPVGMEWHGKGLVHFVPSLQEHAGKDIVIIGGGDSAFDWAYSLKPLASSVTLVHRRDSFRAHAA